MHDHILNESSRESERTPPPGQAAIVLAGFAVGVVLLGIQLWLLTVALDLYLSGHSVNAWLLAVISGVVFLGGLLILFMRARMQRVRR
ncbi:MAG: hypothetical protein H0W02_02875 [Ktedonobacteraceae bacterium]|nr:hypothetical protein [Ktedonobacteraceae bacterium]